MTPVELSEALRAILVAAQTDGTLSLDAGQLPASVAIERPRSREHGDWSSNVALQLAKRAGIAPRVLAGELARRLRNVLGPKAPESEEG